MLPLTTALTGCAKPPIHDINAKFPLWTSEQKAALIMDVFLIAIGAALTVLVILSGTGGLPINAFSAALSSVGPIGATAIGGLVIALLSTDVMMMLVMTAKQSSGLQQRALKLAGDFNKANAETLEANEKIEHQKREMPGRPSHQDMMDRRDMLEPLREAIRAKDTEIAELEKALAHITKEANKENTELRRQLEAFQEHEASSNEEEKELEGTEGQQSLQQHLEETEEQLRINLAETVGLRAELAKLTASANAAAEEADKQRSTIEVLEKAKESSETIKGDLQKQLEAKREKIRDLKEKLEASKETEEPKELEELRQQVEELQSTGAKHLNAFNERKQQVEEAEAARDKAIENHEKLREQLKELQNENAIVADEKERLNGECLALEQNVKILEEKVAAGKQIEDLQADIAELEGKKAEEKLALEEILRARKEVDAMSEEEWEAALKLVVTPTKAPTKTPKKSDDEEPEG